MREFIEDENKIMAMAERNMKCQYEIKIWNEKLWTECVSRAVKNMRWQHIQARKPAMNYYVNLLSCKFQT